MEFELPELIEREVEVGMSGLLTYSNEGSEKEQLGYSVSIKGEPLFGFEEGDWQEGWYVIGRDTLLGDPVFIDLNDSDIPVFKAAHGMGTWNEVCVSDTYSGFLDSLSAIERSKESGKINEPGSLLTEIKSLIGDGEFQFWQLMIDPPF